MKSSAYKPITLLLVSSALCAAHALAGMNELVESIAQSDIEFRRTESDLPHVNLGWLRATRYGETTFTSDNPALDDLSFEQTTFAHGLFLPVYVTKTDVIGAGYYLGTSRFEFEDTDRDDAEVHTVSVAASWLHHIKTNWMSVAFVSPFVSSGLNGGSPWNTEWYAGAMARYYQNSKLQWYMGGFAVLSENDNVIYPYVGAIWDPNPSWSVAAVLPWPSVSYAIHKKWFVRFGASPSGAQWQAEDDDSITLDFGGWDLGLSTEYEVANRVWLGARVGWSGMRMFSINDDGDTDYETDVDSEPFASISVAFRP